MKLNKLGLVLSGGGGKGAYQIGIWKAMRDLGLSNELSAVSGSSVGGLNGAMIAQNKFEQAEGMWLNIERHDMLSIQDVPGVAGRLAMLTASGLVSPLLSHFISTKGFFKQDGLRSMIAEGLDAALLAVSPLPLTVALHNTSANRVDYLPVRDAQDAASLLLGTAALPLIFDEVAIGSSTYTDGGFYWGLPNKNVDNTPIIPLIEAGCNTIVVVYLSADDLSIDPRNYPGIRILPIVPANSLGGTTATLDFSNEGAERRMEQGYNDGLQLFRHLELFLDSEAQYEALWARVRASAEQERKISDQLHTMDQRHHKTVSDIIDFDRQIQRDDFTQPFNPADDDSDLPGSLQSLALANSALLADIERRQIETDVDHFLAQNSNNRAAVETSVLDALSGLSPVTGRATNVRGQNALSRLWGAITGNNQQVLAENDRDLAQAQFAALRLIGAVHEKGALTLEFACTLQNRINGALGDIQKLGERHNQDIRRVYRSLANVYCKLRDRLEEQGNRLNSAERKIRLHDWLLHTNRPRHKGRALASLPVPLRLACMANDFFLLTDGHWTIPELNTLREMCLKVGLDEANPIKVAEFYQHLNEQPDYLQSLTEELVLLPIHQPIGQGNPTARWLRDVRNGTTCEVITTVDTAASCWGYSEGSVVPAWDFLAELLYHLKAAQFSVVRSSDISRYKSRWLEQLQLLDGLVSERILPASFGSEIENLRNIIAAFHLKVPLIGKFSVGKSTLLNRWLQENIQPDDLNACTSLATEFHYAREGEEKLVIHWLEDSQSGATRQEERPLSAYRPWLETLSIDARQPLFIELHLCRRPLARHPDIVLVDTPGLGSNNGQHERALEQYIGEAVSCILCVTRISQVGTGELAFIDRQRSLGQEFSLLVCQEALNNPSERETLRKSLAVQAGVEANQTVRGCSAKEGELSGFEDLLAYFETQKAALFHHRFADRVKVLLFHAEQLIRQQLNLDTTADQLLEQKKLIDKGIARLENNYKDEQESLRRDCRGTIARQVLSMVTSYLRSRRESYAQLILNGQGIGPLLTADVRNACQLAVEQSLTPRFKEACRSLGNHIQLGAFSGPVLANEGVDGLPGDSTFGSATAGAAAGAAVGTMLPVIGTLIGAAIGGLIGVFASRNSKQKDSDNKANEAIESVVAQLQSIIPDMLENQATEFLADMQHKIASQLATQRENLERIEQQLTEDQQRKQEIQHKAKKALDSIVQFLELNNSTGPILEAMSHGA